MKSLKSSGVALAVAAIAAATSAPAMATTTRTGVIEVVISGTVKSPLGTLGSGSCSVTVLTSDTFKNSEGLSVPMTISGSTFHCTLQFDYSWVLASTSSTVQVLYSVEATTKTYTTARTSAALAGAPFAVPASGTTTKFTPAVVL
jgi:hypothetical protein